MASEIKVDTVSEKTSANGVTIDGVNIKDSKIVTANSVDSDVYVDGSIDTAHIADLNITTGKIAADAITAAKIADNAVVTAGINADAVTGAKIADDAINSEHYTDGSIDTAHIADAQITVGKLATTVFTGATDIGADIADADLFLVDDGAGGTIRKTAASRLKTYVGSAGLTLVAASSSTSAVSSVTFTSKFDSTYYNYLIVGDLTVANSAGEVFCVMNDSSGDHAGTHYNQFAVRSICNTDTRVIHRAENQDSFWNISGVGTSTNTAVTGFQFAMQVHDPVTTDRTGIHWQATLQDGSDDSGYIHGAAQFTEAISATGIRFFARTGNLTHHNIRIYGLANS